MKLEILEAIYDKEEFKKLIEMLQSGDKDKVAYAAVRLVALGNSIVAPLIELFGDKKCNSISLDIAGILGNMVTAALKPLLAALKDKNSSVRAGAAAALGCPPITHVQALQPLIDALNDKASWVRVNAARSLATFKNKEALEPLINVLSDTNYDVRCAAAFSLGEIPEERAVAELVRLLNSEDPEVQLIAINSLGKTGDRQVLEQLERLEIQSEFGWLREAATEAIIQIKLK